jgi:hypothetical protein
VPEVCKNTIRETESVAPRTVESAYYTRAHGVYRMLYPALKPIFGKIAEL